MYGCESWTIKKAEHRRIDAFQLWCWRRLLRVPWTSRRSNQSILKEISPEYSLEGLMLKLKLQYFGHLMHRLLRNNPDAGKDWGQAEKGITKDDMVGWHHRLNRHEFEQAPGVGVGQGGLVYSSSWGCKESDTTEQLNWTELTQSAEKKKTPKPRILYVAKLLFRIESERESFLAKQKLRVITTRMPLQEMLKGIL